MSFGARGAVAAAEQANVLTVEVREPRYVQRRRAAACSAGGSAQRQCCAPPRARACHPHRRVCARACDVDNKQLGEGSFHYSTLTCIHASSA